MYFHHLFNARNNFLLKHNRCEEFKINLKMYIRRRSIETIDEDKDTIKMEQRNTENKFSNLSIYEILKIISFVCLFGANTHSFEYSSVSSGLFSCTRAKVYGGTSKNVDGQSMVPYLSSYRALNSFKEELASNFQNQNSSIASSLLTLCHI